MNDDDTMPDQKRMNDNPPVEALAANRQMFLGFLVKRLGNMAEAEDVLQEFA